MSENGEEGSVEVDGDGAKVVGEITVEDIAAGDTPGEVDFTGEINEGIGPGQPSDTEHGCGQDGIDEEFNRGTDPDVDAFRRAGWCNRRNGGWPVHGYQGGGMRE